MLFIIKQIFFTWLLLGFATIIGFFIKENYNENKKLMITLIIFFHPILLFLLIGIWISQ